MFVCRIMPKFEFNYGLSVIRPFNFQLKIENRCQFLIFQFFSSCKMKTFIIVLPFSPVDKNEKINTQVLFSTVNVKKIIEQ